MKVISETTGDDAVINISAECNKILTLSEDANSTASQFVLMRSARNSDPGITAVTSR